MKKVLIYSFVFVFLLYGVSAFYNLALGKDVWINAMGHHGSLFETTRNITDGNAIDTCLNMSGYQFYISIDLGKIYSIKSSRMIFEGISSKDKVTFLYSDNFYKWPFSVYKTYDTNSLNTTEFTIQRDARDIYIQMMLNNWGNSLDVNLCEFEIYGCDVDHYGENCTTCVRDENCEICDVNDGTCYVCKENFTGPNCSKVAENIALQKPTNMWKNSYGFSYENSHFLVDGHTDQLNCIELDLSNATYNLDIYLQETYNVKDVRFYLIKSGLSKVWFNYALNPFYWWGNTPQEMGQNGTVELSEGAVKVIVPYTKQLQYSIIIQFDIEVDGDIENTQSVSICEVEIHGCPANHYGSPCIPCSTNCDQCNAVDGSCICRSGYTGENCTEECSNSTYGVNCLEQCGHCLHEACNNTNGVCLFGCEKGWNTTYCTQPCATGWHGYDCSLNCSSHCITPYLCDRVTGACLGGCATGWVNDTCDTIDMDYCVDWAPFDVSVVYHNITWRREEISNMVRHDPSVNLRCSFTTKPDENLFYDVTWFIDGQSIFIQTVDVSSNFTAVLSAYDILELNKKVGSDVHCNVGAKRKKENVPCRTIVGRSFFAGIRVKNHNIELERKGSKNIELEMTIPFASESIFINGVLQPTSDLNIHLAFETAGASKCGGGGSSNHCEVKVKSFGYHEKHKYENGQWRQNIFFPVYSQDTDGYVINSDMTLRLKTGGTNGRGSRIFEHVSLQDISIRVRDTNQEWKGRSCGVRADPHMYTFDGKWYECQTSGEFINYRNQQRLQWIQSKHHLCMPSYNGPWCVCAVAARAGRDVFLMDLCGENGVINFEMCEDNILQVTKIHDKEYKVQFPTGTTLSIYIMDWNGYFNIDLEIVPSPLDIGNADGLCGYFDGSVDNDFKRRDSNLTDSINHIYPSDFYDSWRIPDNENLLRGDSSVYKNLESLSSNQVPQCTCTKSGKTKCSYSTFSSCNSNRGKKYTCNVHLLQSRRRKRDVSRDTVQGPLLRKKRSVAYVQTEAYAESVCLQAFSDSIEYSTCQQYVTDLSNVSLSNCIEDIKMTGDDNLTQIHVQAALQQCTTFVLLNGTLQEAEPNITYTIQNFCPSNCSNHGTCNGGNCTCDTGYGGSDCSFDLLAPPTITSVPSAGLCDLSSRDCSEATMLGKYFVENMKSLCYIIVKQVDVNHTTITVDHRQVALEERTLFEGFCPHSVNSSGLWVTEITFNISNDGLRFTDTYQIYLYQSQCQEFHNDSGSVLFTLKDNFCYIDGTCVPSMNESSVNECLMCNTTVSRYSWTVYEYCKQETISADNNSSPSSDQLMTIIAVSSSVGGLAVIVITATVIIKTCKKMKTRNQIVDTKLNN